MREKKTHLKLILVAVIVLLLGGILCSLRITDITVTGRKRHTQEQMIELLFPDSLDRNPLYCYYKDKFKPHLEIPFVADYDIIFRSPFKVEIMVYEKSIVGYVSYMNSYMYFDKDGIIVESTSTRLEGIPQISGLEFGQIALNEPLPVEDERIFTEILNLTQVLSIYELSVDEISYDSRGQATLHLGDVRVFLGNSDNMNGKISELRDMLPQLEGLKGTLYLDTYDEMDSDAMYSFIQD